MMRSPHARVRNGSCNCSPDSFGCVSPLDKREQTPSAAGEGLGSSCRRSALAGDPVGESDSSSGYRLRLASATIAQFYAELVRRC